jgi:hypothetical protein
MLEFIMYQNYNKDLNVPNLQQNIFTKRLKLSIITYKKHKKSLYYFVKAFQLLNLYHIFNILLKIMPKNIRNI